MLNLLSQAEALLCPPPMQTALTTPYCLPPPPPPPLNSPHLQYWRKYLRLYEGEPSKRALKLTSIAKINQ